MPCSEYFCPLMLILIAEYVASPPPEPGSTARLQAASPSAIPKAKSRRRFCSKARSSGLLKKPTCINKAGAFVWRQNAKLPKPEFVSGFTPRLGNCVTRRSNPTNTNSALLLRSSLLAM